MVAAAAVAAAIVSARGELAVVAVAPLVLLTVSPRSMLPRTVRIGRRLHPLRCVEDDRLSLTLEVHAPGADRVEAELPHLLHDREGFALQVSGELFTIKGRGGGAGARGAGARGAVRWAVVPHRWGRYRTGPVRVRVLAGNGLYAATIDLPLEEIVVYPGGGTVARATAPRELPARLGEHASRAVGSGVEFAGVRPYADGDRRRDIDWRTSARQQQLFVRQYAAERSFALVLVLDVAVDAGVPGRSTLDLTVRAATGLAQTYLGVHDRVGIVSLGGSLRWLAPAAGARQLHRIAESVMEVRLDDSQVGGGIDRVPAGVLPSGAFVCLLSPLLDGRALEAARDLRARGFGLLVVDVLTTEPDVERGSPTGGLALRVWRMERAAIRAELATLGVPLLAWDGSGDLSGALLHALRAVRPEVRA